MKENWFFALLLSIVLHALVIAFALFSSYLWPKKNITLVPYNVSLYSKEEFNKLTAGEPKEETAKEEKPAAKTDEPPSPPPPPPPPKEEPPEEKTQIKREPEKPKEPPKETKPPEEKKKVDTKKELEKQKEEEKKREEEAKIALEQKKKEEERKKREEEEKKRLAELKQKEEEKKRLEEERKKQEELEKKKLEEQKKKEAEEKKRLEEEKRKQEEIKKAEEEKKRREEEERQRKLEEQRAEQEYRKTLEKIKTKAEAKKEEELLAKKLEGIRERISKEDEPVQTAKGSLTGISGNTLKIGKDEFCERYYNCLELIEKIQSNWLPPKQLLEQKGLTVTLLIKIREDGTILDVTVEKSSGNRLYDASAEKAVKATEKLPPATRELKALLGRNNYFEIGLRFRPDEILIH